MIVSVKVTYFRRVYTISTIPKVSMGDSLQYWVGWGDFFNKIVPTFQFFNEPSFETRKIQKIKHTLTVRLLNESMN